MSAGAGYSSAGATLVEVVHQRAITAGEQIGYTFLADGSGDARSITWSQLDRRARELATMLHEQHASGQPVLLALSSGLAFVEALFGCWYAGAIAVPVSLPRHQRVKHRLDAILADAGARFAIGTAETRQRLGLAAEMTWIDPGVTSPAGAARPVTGADSQAAVLQYTSGSTGVPRGVVVTQRNLMRNSALIAEACGHGPGQTIAGWLPLFHDMGLIGLVIQAAFSGARCVLMPPERFLMRPWLWLQMISDYRVCSSPAPNFAYDLCVDKVSEQQKASLDLSCWRNALNGSEPVRAVTLDRFSAAFASCGFKSTAFFPCYGLAEATLFVTGPATQRTSVRRTAAGLRLESTDANGHVSCGRPFGDTQIAIVDPQTKQPARYGEVGEIWVCGESCAGGYWNNPSASAETFNAELAIDGNDSRPWLRTGDLGYIADGELFITGRRRELIILAGKNHFPVDIERTVESADVAIAPSGAVAFSVDVHGIERMVVVAEVRRELGRSDAGAGLDLPAVVRRVRVAVAAEHDVVPHEVVLVRSGAVPRTTSGKISHGLTRDAYQAGTLERVESSPHAYAAV